MRNDYITGEELLETGGSLVKKAVGQVVKQASVSAQTATGQLAGSPQAGTNENQNANSGQTQDDTNKDFVKDLYGNSNQPVQQQNQATPQNNDDQQKINEARKKLQQHMEMYYKPTFEKPKPKEENVADKLEREEQEKEAKKMEELQEEQKKEEIPNAVRRAQNIEKHRGASG